MLQLFPFPFVRGRLSLFPLCPGGFPFYLDPPPPPKLLSSSSWPYRVSNVVHYPLRTHFNLWSQFYMAVRQFARTLCHLVVPPTPPAQGHPAQGHPAQGRRHKVGKNVRSWILCNLCCVHKPLFSFSKLVHFVRTVMNTRFVSGVLAWAKQCLSIQYKCSAIVIVINSCILSNIV